MDKSVMLLLCVMDIIVSLFVVPIIYVLDVVYLIYVSIKYDYDFMKGFMDINKKHIYYIVNGFKIHKERIFGV